MPDDFTALRTKLQRLANEQRIAAERKALKATGEVILQAVQDLCPIEAGKPEGILEVGELHASLKTYVKIATDEKAVDGAEDQVIVAPSTLAYINAVAGQTYNIRIRSLRSNGGTSVWVELDGFVAGLVLNTQSADGYGIGSLVGEAYPNNTAAIDCMPFTAQVGSLSLPIFPSGAVMITTDGTIGGSGAALLQQTQYYVYYVDTAYAGGNVTPIATTNKADFVGKLGFFLIDSIITPYVSSSGGGTSTTTLYYPSTYSDTGTRSTANPGQAYDGDLATYALCSGVTTTTTWTTGEGSFSGFPAIALASESTLSINAYARMIGDGQCGCTISWGSGSTAGSATVFEATATFAQQTYTYTIPANVALNSVSVHIYAYPAVEVDPGSSGAEPPVGPGAGGGAGIVTSSTYDPASTLMSVYEIYITG
ncbi:MAG: hypothetical protein PW792_08275 [Acidobacteriaceae bacterium]|nr:hypothetical protein [Acidobacteriaceae bacterium]